MKYHQFKEKLSKLRVFSTQDIILIDENFIKNTHGINDKEHDGNDELLWISIDNLFNRLRVLPTEISSRFVNDYNQEFENITNPVYITQTGSSD
jgi:hypothetical protein